MATKQDVKDAVYSELKTVITDNTSVSTPKEHVGILNRDNDAVYPFLGFEILAGNRINTGITGDTRVDALILDASDNLDKVRYRRDYELFVDIGVLADDSDDEQKDALYTDLVDHFDSFSGETVGKEPSDLQSDVSEIEDQGFDDAAPNSPGVVGDRQTFRLEYSRFITEDTDVVPMDTVNLRVEDFDDSDVVYNSDTVD